MSTANAPRRVTVGAIRIGFVEGARGRYLAWCSICPGTPTIARDVATVAAAESALLDHFARGHR